MSARHAGHETNARGMEAPVRGGSGWRLALAGCVLLAGCFDQSVGPLFESDGRISVSNDELDLDPRMSFPDTPVPIDPDPVPVSGPAAVSDPSGAPAMAPSDIDLTLTASQLRLTPQQRIDNLQASMKSLAELDRARKAGPIDKFNRK